MGRCHIEGRGEIPELEGEVGSQLARRRTRRGQADLGARAKTSMWKPRPLPPCPERQWEPSPERGRPRWSLRVRQLEEEPPEGVTVTRGPGHRDWHPIKPTLAKRDLQATSVERAVDMSGDHFAGRMLRDPVDQATHWRPAPAAAQPAPALPPARASLVTRGDCWPLRIRVKFNGDLKQLGALLIRVRSFVTTYAEVLPNDEAMVYCVVRALDGEAADWAVTLYEEEAEELHHFEAFMVALRQRFKDPLADRKAKIKLQTIKQGGRTAAVYTREFRPLDDRLRRKGEEMLIKYFQRGLDPEVLYVCLRRGSAKTLQEWYVLAQEVDFDLAQIYDRQYRTPGPGRQGPSSRRRPIWCVRCLQGGHGVSDCPSLRSAPKTPRRRKPAAKRNTVARKGAKVVEFTPPSSEDKGTATEDEEPTVESDSSGDDDGYFF